MVIHIEVCPNCFTCLTLCSLLMKCDGGVMLDGPLWRRGLRAALASLPEYQEIVLVTARGWRQIQWDEAKKTRGSCDFFFFFFGRGKNLNGCFLLSCCKKSHNINTKQPLLPIISMSFCCGVTLLALSHNGGAALAAVRSAPSTSPGHGGRLVGGSLVGESMED